MIDDRREDVDETYQKSKVRNSSELKWVMTKKFSGAVYTRKIGQEHMHGDLMPNMMLCVQ